MHVSAHIRALQSRFPALLEAKVGAQRLMRRALRQPFEADFALLSRWAPEPGEVFIEVAKEGSTVGGLCDAIGILTSIALQRGVPLEELVRKFQGTSFEPAGPTTNREQPQASSIVDYVFVWLGRKFVDRFQEDYDRMMEARKGE